MNSMDWNRYLSRLGLSVDVVDSPDYGTLARLQRAHVTTVPFETFAITGDPFGEQDGAGVSLALSDLFEKIVERERGGFCFELNGLFATFLDSFGYEVDRIAAMMLGDDGDPQPPANHHVSIVALDDRYLVDVGMGVPTLRRPLPIDGRVRTDEVGVSWRVAESDRPDSEYVLQYTKPGDDEWSNRYVFNDVPRELRYFEATCEFLATAPESPFTGDPVVTRATDDGHMKLTTDSLRRYDETGTTETDLTEPEWWDRLETDFGLDLREKPVQGANR